jgi:hypothetical protein
VNERIQELEKQATDIVKCGLNGTATAESFNRKKFAQLIVQECMEVVEKQLGGGNGDGVEWDRAIDFTYEDMKKHFGVEE